MKRLLRLKQLCLMNAASFIITIPLKKRKRNTMLHSVHPQLSKSEIFFFKEIKPLFLNMRYNASNVYNVMMFLYMERGVLLLLFRLVKDDTMLIIQATKKMKTTLWNLSDLPLHLVGYSGH